MLHSVIMGLEQLRSMKECVTSERNIGDVYRAEFCQRLIPVNAELDDLEQGIIEVDLTE